MGGDWQNTETARATSPASASLEAARGRKKRWGKWSLEIFYLGSNSTAALEVNILSPDGGGRVKLVFLRRAVHFLKTQYDFRWRVL